MKSPFVRRSKVEAEAATAERRLAEARATAEKFRDHTDKYKAEAKRLRGVISLLEHQARGEANSRPLLALRLKGEGIEIGALDHPLQVPEGVTVRYVDLLTREENLAKFTTLNAETLVETHYLCDGQTLPLVPDESQDFVIANHMLEHCINPLKAVETFLRVLKPGGRLYIALPDKRFTFDYKRKTTPWEHVKNDYLTNRTTEDREVYEEYRDCVDLNVDVDALYRDQIEIHHHAWTQSEIMEMFINARRQLGMPLEIEMMTQHANEVILLMQKGDPVHGDQARP